MSVNHNAKGLALFSTREMNTGTPIFKINKNLHCSGWVNLKILTQIKATTSTVIWRPVWVKTFSCRYLH